MNSTKTYDDSSSRPRDYSDARLWARKYKRCKECDYMQYFAGADGVRYVGCDYCSREGHSRNCPPGDLCTRFVPRNPDRSENIARSNRMFFFRDD